MTNLNIQHLNYSIEERVLFEDASINIDFNTLFLHGPNGCGKSTLLNLIFFHSRKYNILFENLPLKRNNIAYIQQELDLFDDLTVKQNLNLLKFDNREPLEYIFKNNLENKNLSSLSGGERQIINICIGLASPGQLLLIDEPLNNLSNTHRLAIEELITLDERPKIIISHQMMNLEGKILAISKRKLYHE